MSNLKTQFGKSATCDFEELTWTFEMPDDFFITAGEFAILPKDKYEAVIKMLDKILRIENAAFSLPGFNAGLLKGEITGVLDDL